MEKIAIVVAVAVGRWVGFEKRGGRERRELSVEEDNGWVRLGLLSEIR